MRSTALKFILVFAIVFLGYFFYQRNLAPENSKTSKSNSEGETQLPEDFKSFYNTFQSDSIFQLDHIAFPMERISDDSIKVEGRWTRENWKLHHPFDDKNGAFSRSFEVRGDFVVEYIIDLTGEFTMMRRFAKLSDGWNLIYYKPMGRYGQTINTPDESGRIEIKPLK